MNSIRTLNEKRIRFIKYNEPLKEFKLGEITETVSRPIKMEDEKEYLLVTVKRRNEGVVKRGIYKGKEVKVKSQFKVAAGDFLISKRQIIHGACEIVPQILEGAIVSNEYHILHGKEEVLSTEYLNLLSKTPKLKNYFALACVGVDIEKMLFRIEDWKKRFIKIPNIEEQETIVSFFNLLNERIEKQQEKIENLEQLKKGMMQKIFSQELRFKDEDGMEFPGWEKALFGEVVTNKSEKFNPKKETIILPCIELENIEQGSGQLIGNIDNSDQKSMKNKFDEGSVLFGKLRPYLKKYLFTNFEGLCSTEIWVLNSKNSRLINEFIYFFIQKTEFLEATNKSIGSKMPRADWNTISELSFKIPTVKEQKKIVYYLKALENKIVKEKEKLVILEEQKKGFMGEMFI